MHCKSRSQYQALIGKIAFYNPSPAYIYDRQSKNKYAENFSKLMTPDQSQFI